MSCRFVTVEVRPPASHRSSAPVSNARRTAPRDDARKRHSRRRRSRSCRSRRAPMCTVRFTPPIGVRLAGDASGSRGTAPVYGMVGRRVRRHPCPATKSLVPAGSDVVVREPRVADPAPHAMNDHDEHGDSPRVDAHDARACRRRASGSRPAPDCVGEYIRGHAPAAGPRQPTGRRAGAGGGDACRGRERRGRGRARDRSRQPSRAATGAAATRCRSGHSGRRRRTIRYPHFAAFVHEEQVSTFEGRAVTGEMPRSWPYTDAGQRRSNVTPAASRSQVVGVTPSSRSWYLRTRPTGLRGRSSRNSM